MRLFFLLVFLAVSLFLDGCGAMSGKGKDIVVIWTGWQNEVSVLAELAGEFSQKTGIQVNVVNVPFTDLKNKFQLAAPAYAGPDLITGPNDWTGPFATANLISPLSESFNKSDILSVGLKSLEFQKKLFALPLFMEGVALIYNKDFISAPPSNMHEVLQISKQLRSKDQYGLVFDVTNFYFTWPVFSGWGATVFQPGTEGDLAPLVSLSDAKAVLAAEYLRQLVVKEKLFPEMPGDVANALFLERKAAMIINGPWFIEDVRKSGINFAISKLPQLPNGKNPMPFVGVQGVYLNKRSRHAKESLEFIKFLSVPENIVRLSTASGRIPVNRRGLNLLKDNYVITAFSSVLANGVPLPNIPAMTQVWPYMQEGLKLIFKNEDDVGYILKTSNKRINEAINRLVK